jgi:molecular chaperone DnaK
MTSERTIGIDLGTTNTLVAEMNVAGDSNIWRTEVLRTREGELLIPSVVLFEDDRTIVGREAQLRGRAHPHRLAACAKRTLGQSFYGEPIGGEQIPPEVIQACILAAAKRQLLGEDGRNGRVVIAVPAHFNEMQRHATAMAAQMAGMNLVDLVNEPVAAALAFAEYTLHLSLVRPHGEPASVLVFDLGGYTFEATVLSVRPGTMTMVATDHDSFLGGHEWDLRLADLLADAFVRQHALDPREKLQHLDQLVERVSQVKHALSVRSHTSVRLTFGAQSETIKLTREDFENATADLVERAGRICDQVLQQARLDWGRVQRVLLVGGATRMPMIGRMLTERLGRAPDNLVAPEEAVARGAAIYAAKAIHDGGRPPQLQVTSISTHSLGIEEIDQSKGRCVNKVLIPKGTPLPARVSHRFVTESNHKSIAIRVLEGESPEPSQCLTIGRIFLRGLPADLAKKWRVEVTYEYSASGRLSVDAQVQNANSCTHLETIRPAGGSEAHMLRWRPVVNAQAGFAAYREVRAWEQASDASSPLVVAGLDATESDGALAFLRRMMPFIFRPRQQKNTSEAASDASAVQSLTKASADVTSD